MAGFDVDGHVAQLEREGYTIIRDVLPQEEIEKSKGAIDEVLEAEREIATQYGLQSEDLKMCFNAQGKHPYFYGLALRYPEPVQVIRRLLGDDMFAHNAHLNGR